MLVIKKIDLPCRDVYGICTGGCIKQSLFLGTTSIFTSKHSLYCIVIRFSLNSLIERSLLLFLARQLLFVADYTYTSENIVPTLSKYADIHQSMEEKRGRAFW